jgi:hypothetical protein
MLIEIYDNGVLQYIMKEYGVNVYKKQVLAGIICCYGILSLINNNYKCVPCHGNAKGILGLIG